MLSLVSVVVWCWISKAMGGRIVNVSFFFVRGHCDSKIRTPYDRLEVTQSNKFTVSLDSDRISQFIPSCSLCVNRVFWSDSITNEELYI